MDSGLEGHCDTIRASSGVAVRPIRLALLRRSAVVVDSDCSLFPGLATAGLFDLDDEVRPISCRAEAGKHLEMLANNLAESLKPHVEKFSPGSFSNSGHRTGDWPPDTRAPGS